MQLRFAFVLMFLILLPAELYAQRAVINGAVINEYGEPMVGANVSVAELLYGTSTDEEGLFVITIPAYMADGREITLLVSAEGYFQSTRSLLLTRGSQSHDFLLEPDHLKLDEPVLTGLSATSRKELFFEVGHTDFATLQETPGSSPLASLQGKIAGLAMTKNSGAPGDAYSVVLRGMPTLSGTGQPLFVVDGIMLGANEVDLDAMDIEQVEVLKGPAAAAQYGSRARAGVIQIKTSRGTHLPLNALRITLRNEFGFPGLEHRPAINQSHNFRISEAGEFLDAADEVVDYGPAVVVDRDLSGASYADNVYAGETFDVLDQFFGQASTYSNFIAIDHNAAAVNVHASFSNLSEAGIVPGLDGYSRLAGRLNADYRVLPSLALSVSGAYTMANNDAPGLSPGASFLEMRYSPFTGLLSTSPYSDLHARNAAGALPAQADPLATDINPAYALEHINFSSDRTRMLGHAGLSFLPTTWMTLRANIGYDRSEQDHRAFYAAGLQTLLTGEEADALRERIDGVGEALNYDAGVTFRQPFGDVILRSEWQYRHEDYDAYQSFYTGEPDAKLTSSLSERVLSDVYLGTLAVDFRRKLYAEAMALREGNSLFGSDERWQHYFRVGGSYRVSEEQWWPMRRSLPEFKLFAAYGTAGGRPRFDAQYANIEILNDRFIKRTLGNHTLKPELTSELETGLDVAVGDRIRLNAVYAFRNTDDLLLEVPLPGFLGYESQWQNAGALESNTLEASITADLIRTRHAELQVGVLFDRTRQKITNLNIDGFTAGPYGAFLFESGEEPGTLYGSAFVTDFDQLPAGTDAGLFDINDDGYVVAVGAGNSYLDGFDGQLWGTTVTAGEMSYAWGVPIKYADETGNDKKTIGSVFPDVNLGFPVRYRYKGLSAYMLWNARIGSDIYNFTNQASYRSGRSADQDQAGKGDAYKKPVRYYEVLYDAGNINAHFVEDGSFVRLREIAVGYTFGWNGLSGFLGNVIDKMTIRFVGRNLFTFTDYSGFDPEMGTTFSSGAVGGNAMVYRLDSFGYPNYRTFSGILEIQF